MRCLAAITRREVDAFRTASKPPVQARYVLEAVCVVLGLEIPRPSISESEPVKIVARAAQRIFADWMTLLRDCEKALFNPLPPGAAERLRKLLAFSDFPSTDWAVANNPLLHALIVWLQTVDVLDRRARPGRRSADGRPSSPAKRRTVRGAPCARATRPAGSPPTTPLAPSPPPLQEKDKDQAGSILTACRGELMETSLAAVSQLRGARAPGPGVRLVGEAVCRLLGKPPAVIPGTEVEDYWMALQSLLGDWRSTSTALQVVHPTAVAAETLEFLHAVVTSPEYPEDSELSRVGGPCVPPRAAPRLSPFPGVPGSEGCAKCTV